MRRILEDQEAIQKSPRTLEDQEAIQEIHRTLEDQEAIQKTPRTLEDQEAILKDPTTVKNHLRKKFSPESPTNQGSKTPRRNQAQTRQTTRFSGKMRLLNV